MVIDTKFNIGQDVFVLVKNKVHKFKIHSFRIKVYEGKEDKPNITIVEHEHTPPADILHDFDDCFATKQELLDSL